MSKQTPNNIINVALSHGQIIELLARIGPENYIQDSSGLIDARRALRRCVREPRPTATSQEPSDARVTG